MGTDRDMDTDTVANLLERKNIRDSVVNCRACSLRDGCTSPVPFNGPSPTKIVVVGEAPGEQEDREQIPFVGKAGKLLRGYLRHNGMDDSMVAYVNAVSCFPKRTPTAKEVVACEDNLANQISLLAPSYILYVGGIALSTAWAGTRITDARGNWFKPDVRGEVLALATWHPSAVLRNDDLRDEFQVDIEDFAEIAVKGESPFKKYWCVKCGKYTDIVIGPGDVVSKLGMPLCGKCLATRRGLAGGGKKSRGSSTKPRKTPPPKTESMI